ncbi:MAG: sigma 54-interacting transcriptional regulator, partial [Terriglobia bacterium]
LPLSMQAKLLRFLQEGEVQRLGGPDIIRVDVRVIAATNAQLAKRVAEKAFREDLYYRVSVFPIDLIPLRERPEDILALGGHFLSLFCREANSPQKTISDAAERLLEKHSWPGNVRELRHVVERAFILSESNRAVLPEHISVQAPWH